MIRFVDSESSQRPPSAAKDAARAARAADAPFALEEAPVATRPRGRPRKAAKAP